MLLKTVFINTLLFLIFFVIINESGVYGSAIDRLSIYEQKKYKRQIERLGLYADSQYVLSLTVHTLKPAIYDKDYATLVEVGKKKIAFVFNMYLMKS